MTKKKKIVVLVISILLVLVVAGTTFGWYKSAQTKKAQTKTATVMTPYNLYLLNAGDHQALQFAVGSLHPGETKQIVFCVSNKDPAPGAGEGLVRDSEFQYELELVHTENLAVHYKIHPLTTSVVGGAKSVTIAEPGGTTTVMYYLPEITGTDKTTEMLQKVFTDPNNDNRVNKGSYKLFSDADMKLAFQSNNYEYDYYVVEIDWDTITNFNDYKKETDLVYLVVNAKQPKPVLVSTP